MPQLLIVQMSAVRSDLAKLCEAGNIVGWKYKESIYMEKHGSDADRPWLEPGIIRALG